LPGVMLRPAFVGSTRDRSRCCQRRRLLLQWAVSFTGAAQGSRCCKRWRRLLQETAGSATIGIGVCYKGQRLLQAGCWCLLRVAFVFATIGGDYCYYKGGHGAKGAERRLLRMPEAERFVTSGGSCCEHQRRLLQTERHHAARRPANLAAVLPQAICEGRWGCRHGLRGGKPGSTSPALAVRECREERRG
jgi:hypothetical protein